MVDEVAEVSWFEEVARDDWVQRCEVLSEAGERESKSGGQGCSSRAWRVTRGGQPAVCVTHKLTKVSACCELKA